MLSVVAKMDRESLVREIFAALHQWPELDRHIFSQAHYHGQSLETISRSVQLSVEEVSGILRRCDRQLHESLKAFRKDSDCGKSFPFDSAISRPAA